MTTQVKATIGSTSDSKFKECKITSQGDVYTTTHQVQEGGVVNLTQNVSSSLTGYALLIDLSDTTDFPHSNTGYISLDYVKLQAAFGTNNADGEIKIGVITRNDSTDGDVNWLFSSKFHSGGSAQSLAQTYNFQPCSLDVTSSKYLTNDTSTNDSNFSTSSPLPSPKSGPSVFAAVGDIVVQFIYDGSNTYDANITCKYHSH